jgi:hypothetical protein
MPAPDTIRLPARNARVAYVIREQVRIAEIQFKESHFTPTEPGFSCADEKAQSLHPK